MNSLWAKTRCSDFVYIFENGTKSKVSFSHLWLQYENSKCVPINFYHILLGLLLTNTFFKVDYCHWTFLYYSSTILFLFLIPYLCVFRRSNDCSSNSGGSLHHHHGLISSKAFADSDDGMNAYGQSSPRSSGELYFLTEGFCKKLLAPACMYARGTFRHKTLDQTNKHTSNKFYFTCL